MYRLKHWQIFILSFIPLFTALHIEDEYYRELIKSISLLPVIFYFFSVGTYLNNINEIKNNYFFVFNCVYMMIVIVLIGGLGGKILNEHMIISILLMIYFLLAYIQVVDHLAIQLRIAEGKAVDNYKQYPDFLLFFIWPIGLWMLQPRIEKIR